MDQTVFVDLAEYIHPIPRERAFGFAIPTNSCSWLPRSQFCEVCFHLAQKTTMMTVVLTSDDVSKLSFLHIVLKPHLNLVLAIKKIVLVPIPCWFLWELTNKGCSSILLSFDIFDSLFLESPNPLSEAWVSNLERSFMLVYCVFQSSICFAFFSWCLSLVLLINRLIFKVNNGMSTHGRKRKNLAGAPIRTYLLERPRICQYAYPEKLSFLYPICAAPEHLSLIDLFYGLRKYKESYGRNWDTSLVDLRLKEMETLEFTSGVITKVWSGVSTLSDIRSRIRTRSEKSEPKYQNIPTNIELGEIEYPNPNG
ncbi:LOW QUALITY PROTEIN: hypothetical protein YC2023_040086 [Brassica napus]